MGSVSGGRVRLSAPIAAVPAIGIVVLTTVLRVPAESLGSGRRRFGWRRLKILLEREGIRMNHKKLRRLDPAPKLSSLITRIRSGCGPFWTGLRTRSA